MKRLPHVSDTAVARAQAASDEAAILAIQNGDRDAFRDWVRRHDARVRGIIYAVLGRRDRLDDVAQQVWATVWQRVGELRDVTCWRAWLFRLARNAALDAGRDATRCRARNNGWLRNAPQRAGPPRPDEAMIADETVREVLGAIEALPAIYREPFVLRHVQGWSYRQIADAIDMPVASVETRLVRAMRRIRQTLRKKGVLRDEP